jgi:hypothetical protein
MYLGAISQEKIILGAIIDLTEFTKFKDLAPIIH